VPRMGPKFLNGLGFPAVFVEHVRMLCGLTQRAAVGPQGPTRREATYQVGT